MNLKKLDYFLIFLNILIILFIPFLLSNGGIGEDFNYYINLADKLPAVEDNLFPLGFPLFLRLFKEITNEYFYSSILLKLICFLFILWHSYKKQFYFREVLLLMCLKSTTWIFIYQCSEYIGLPFLYLFIYSIHQLFSDKISSKKFFITVSILGFILCTIRYANVFIFISSLPFVFFLKGYSERIKFTLFSTIVCIGMLLSIYLLFNYLHIGSFASESKRINNETDHFWKDTYVDFIGFINLSNPFFYLKTFDYTTKTKLFLSFIFIIIDFIFWYISFRLLKKTKNIFVKYLVIVAILNGIITFFAAMAQGIEPLGIRILFNSSYLFYFALLIVIRENNVLSDKILFIICLLSLVYNCCFIVKIPSNFLFYKHAVEKVAQNKSSLPKYYFDDDEKVIETVYTIPIINKTFYYTHENKQPNYIYKAILRLINPSIIFLDKAPQENNSEIIYSSEINNFIEHKKSAD
ncbi:MULTISPECIES: hypothetical protein [Empedobacter]|nr:MULTISPECIES: hypothetical protein [Empedobacter]MDH0673085.1 hypothetical protein [Empedobacter sp. GD03861]